MYQASSSTSRFILYLLLLVILFPSCIPHKDLITLNGNETVPKDFKTDKLMHTSQVQPYQVYRIQAFDQLLIRVNAFEGSTEQFLDQEFANDNNVNQNMNFEPASIYFNTYSVDERGYVNLPVVGKIEVAGLTANEIKEKLDEAYKPYLKFASTNVKMANSRITVIGEVKNPGVHYLYNERNTILDAIGLAGDFTDFANRKKIKIVRQTDEGLASIYLNMNRSEFLYSPYYYIRPYDVVYVEPSRRKSRDVGSNATGIVISGISVGALILSLFIN